MDIFVYGGGGSQGRKGGRREREMKEEIKLFLGKKGNKDISSY